MYLPSFSRSFSSVTWGEENGLATPKSDRGLATLDWCVLGVFTVECVVKIGAEGAEKLDALMALSSLRRTLPHASPLQQRAALRRLLQPPTARDDEELVLGQSDHLRSVQIRSEQNRSSSSGRRCAAGRGSIRR